MEFFQIPIVMKKLIFILALFSSSFLYAQNLDIDLLKEINLNRNTRLDDTYRFFTYAVTPVSISVPILLFGIGMVKKDSITKQKSLYLGASVLSTAIISTALKYSVNRTRPFISYPYLENVTNVASPSFPSGHTSDAFAIATSLSLAYPKWYVIVPSYTFAGAVAYSRMHLGVHYPSDVLAGAVIGAGSAYLCFKGQQWQLKRRSEKIN